MDPQVRNVRIISFFFKFPKLKTADTILWFQFRDFLQLYNKLTETCFYHCTDNFFNRNLSQDEVRAIFLTLLRSIDDCEAKFISFSQFYFQHRQIVWTNA